MKNQQTIMCDVCACKHHNKSNGCCKLAQITVTPTDDCATAHYCKTTKRVIFQHSAGLALPKNAQKVGVTRPFCMRPILHTLSKQRHAEKHFTRAVCTQPHRAVRLRNSLKL